MSNISLKQLNNKSIGLLGLGIENHALLRFLLKKKIKCQITICDARDKKMLGEKYNEFIEYNNIQWRLGKRHNQRLDEFDILFRSPGWPIDCPGIQERLKVKSTKYEVNEVLNSPMKLFFDLCPTKNIIGVTGTKGKGTTSSLIHGILKEAGKRVWLGGNIGVAPFAFIDKIKKDDWVVLELSSFQLEDIHKSPHIAVITNFTSEHLAPADPNNPNYHRTIKDYWEAKANIFKWQTNKDYLVVNTKLASRIAKGGRHFFTKSDLPSSLLGEHNKENIAAAVEVAKIVGIKERVIRNAVLKFKGLEHRIEFVSEKNGVRYFDDSFATTPEASITALRSFQAPIILLAGGADKGADFRQFAKEIKKRVKFVVLFDGQATPRIKKELILSGYAKINIRMVKSMKEGIMTAEKKARSGDVVLLSTACASFGMFKNYKERGNQFKLLVAID